MEYLIRILYFIRINIGVRSVGVKMKTVELNCGTKSFSKVFKKLGYKTWTTDINPIFNPDYLGDMLEESTQDIIFNEIKTANIVWMSPVCTYWSLSAGNKYLKKVWYCQYGDKRAKPTNIWTNLDIEFKTCFNGNKYCHHEQSPRGSKTGTQGLKNSMERSKIPEKLFYYIYDIINKNQRCLNDY
jgi:hypothetical protein